MRPTDPLERCLSRVLQAEPEKAEPGAQAVEHFVSMPAAPGLFPMGLLRADPINLAAGGEPGSRGGRSA